MTDNQLLLQEGDIIELVEGHVVYANIPAHFAYSNKKGCYDLVNHEARISGELAYLAGRYVVHNTAFTGGGGPAHDSFPNGHCVYCERITDGNKVRFYQSGCFTAMIKDIKPVGRAVRKWVDLSGADLSDQQVESREVGGPKRAPPSMYPWRDG